MKETGFTKVYRVWHSLSKYPEPRGRETLREISLIILEAVKS